MKIFLIELKSNGPSLMLTIFRQYCLKKYVVNMCSRAKYQVTGLSCWQVMIQHQSNIEFYDR